ncbi:MAG: pentapeptide repeat-containing protein [Symploca sp. SIO1A3]|nr:pentapeptide repeat-containing protein [Symploca sp. SIO1A3]
MSGEPEIQVEKSVSVLHKDIKVNPKSLFISLGKAAINGAFLKWDELAKSGVEILDALGLEKEPGEIAGLLIVRSLMQAMQDLLRENRELVKQPDNLQGLYQQLNSSLASGELVINQEFFLRPQQLPIVQTAKTGFLQWLEEFVEKPVEAQKISDRLPTYFIFALNDQWVKHSQDYLVLKEVLDTPFTQASKREQGWLRYRAWLQKRVEEPMFLEAFSLKQVYVPLRAYYEREVKRPPEQRLERGIVESKDNERVVVDLNKELETWLQEAKSDDAIRLISGGPGSGKSSFSKIFAAQLAEKGEIPVLFIPLHLFKLSDDLVKAVGEFVQVGGLLPHNPLDISDVESRLLIIFDGLDELSMQGKIAAEAAREFIEEVRFQVNQFNQAQINKFNQHQTRLQVLISGREVVVQANRSKFHQPQQLLYLLPYFVIKAKRKGYIDEQKLLKQDQRQLWWQSYGKAKGKNYTGLPPELDRWNLLDITTQPLLNYLVGLSIERDKLQFSEDTNLNQIYEDLLEAVYERGYENNRYHRVTEGIQKDDFTDILEEIALACWHGDGDGRTTTVGEIEKHCDNSGLRGILDRFQESFNEDSKASVTRLLTAFYFRESSGVRASEKTFEFTHKSFGEYLAAKRIVLGVKLIYEDLEERKKNRRKGCDESEALVTWANLCGASAMDEYLFRFICDEIGLQNPSDVGKWQKTLCSLIEFMLNHGMPMECLTDIPNFQEKMRQARNAEEALLVVLNACARVTKEVSEIKWPSRDTFGAWISRLQGQRIGEDNVLALDCLSFLDLQGCILQIRDFYRANLEGAYLYGANLEGAYLYGANLEGAYLYGANLYEANLQRANLYEANLQRANLQRANLQRANLQRANLEGANLYGANLEGAYLYGANLEGAYLEGAYLYEANLEGANLEGANLEGAYLKGVILEGVILEGANLERANLYEANLERANLYEANLYEANLERANLEGANLKGTCAS